MEEAGHTGQMTLRHESRLGSCRGSFTGKKTKGKKREKRGKREPHYVLCRYIVCVGCVTGVCTVTLVVAFLSTGVLQRLTLRLPSSFSLLFSPSFLVQSLGGSSDYGGAPTARSTQVQSGYFRCPPVERTRGRRARGRRWGWRQWRRGGWRRRRRRRRGGRGERGVGRRPR